MKAVKIYQAGGPEQLIYQDVPTPDIKEGWSLVKIKGFGINHSEIFTREGKSPSVQFPRILGIECVGEVVQSSTPTLAVGQKVVSIMGEMGRAFDGSYAEYVLLPNEQIYPVHTDLDWTTLAVIPETYYTAFSSLQQLRIEPQDRVLVRGAGSGVGIAFAQLLKAQFPHIELHGSTRNPAKAARLQAVGFDGVITEVDGKLQTDQNYDKILELVGTPTLLKRLDFPKDLQDLAQNYPLSGLIDPKLKRIWQWQINAEQRFIPNARFFLPQMCKANCNQHWLDALALILSTVFVIPI